MQNKFTQTSTKSWGSRILSSISGIIFGLIMFIASFALIFWNEGRLNLSELAQTAIEIPSTQTAPAQLHNQLVYTTGTLQSTGQIGDTFLKEGNYLSIERKVEMYAWQEETQTESQTNLGGSETTDTTYTYKKEWSDNPKNSDEFFSPEGHLNPQMPLSPTAIKVQTAQVGLHNLDISQITLPNHRNLALTADNIILTQDFKLANDQYLFKGTGSLSNPEIGDLRISYAIVPNPLNTATVFGKVDSTNQSLAPYYGAKNTTLYRIFEGTRDTAISELSTEHTILTWTLRLVGFLLMWFGLLAMFGPVSVFLDVLPIFGSISRVGLGIITFIIALSLSVITILVSLVAYNVFALIAVVLLFIIAIARYLRRKRIKTS